MGRGPVRVDGMTQPFQRVEIRTLEENAPVAPAYVEAVRPCTPISRTTRLFARTKHSESGGLVLVLEGGW